MSFERSLFGDEKPYGSKRVRDAGHVPERVGAVQPGNTNRFRGGEVYSNPLGAPPLDWWVIDDEL